MERSRDTYQAYTVRLSRVSETGTLELAAVTTVVLLCIGTPIAWRLARSRGWAREGHMPVSGRNSPRS